MTCGIFYYWNATPTRAGITRDLEAMASSGFECVYLHPLPDAFHKQNFFCGMTCAYLGKHYFSLARFMVRECRRLGLKMMLYDEGGWPSGSVLGQLIRRYPECRVRSYIRNPEGQIVSQNEDIPDLLDASTTRRFIAMTHEKYFEAFGEEFGKTVRGIFADEPFWTSQPGWEMVRYHRSFPRIFRRKYQQDFKKEVLPLLFDGSAELPGAEEARRRYLEVSSELFAKNYSAELAKWCRRHYIALEGHLDS